MHRFISVLMLFGMMLSATHVNAFAQQICEPNWPVIFDGPPITDPAFIVGDQQIQYFLSINGPDWLIDRRYIANQPATLVRCAGCGYNVSGHVYIGAKTFHVSNQNETQLPQNGQERMELGYEYPPTWAVRLEKPNLIPLASREGLHLNSLSGYAVLYKLKDGWRQNAFPKADPELFRDFQSSNLMVISMWDECALLEAGFYSPASNAVNWDILDKFLRDITVKKITSAYVKPPPYVRPKCPDESIECFRESLGLKN